MACATDKLPLGDAFLKHVAFVDVQMRANCGVEDALSFVDRQVFPHAGFLMLSVGVEGVGGVVMSPWSAFKT